MIEELLDALGDSFRGLWKSYIISEDDIPDLGKWSVTFIYKGHYVETPLSDNPIDALKYAVNKLI